MMKLIALLIALFSSLALAQATQPATQATPIPAPIAVQLPPTPDMSRMLQAAVSRVPLNNGTLNIAPGDYWLNHRVVVANFKNLTINAAGATWHALPTMSIASHDGVLLDCENFNGLTIKGLKFDGNGKVRGFAGAPVSIYCYSGRNLIIDGCGFANDACDGVFVWGGAPAALRQLCQRVEIVNCTFDSPNRNAISIVGAQHVLIHHNRFANISANDPKAGVDIEPNAGDPPGSTMDVVVENNTFTNCYQAWTAKQTARPTNLTFAHNSISGGQFGANNEAANVNIIGNTFIGTAKWAIGSDNGGSAVISGNTLAGCGLAIYVEPGNTVGANTIK